MRISDWSSDVCSSDLWAVEQLPGSFTTLLGPPTFGFPFNYFTPQLSQAYDNLWADKGEIREGFRNAWTAVAARWKDQSYSMGYDLFNEAWSGLEFETCLVPLLGCPSNDANELQPWYAYTRDGIRSVLGRASWRERVCQYV